MAGVESVPETSFRLQEQTLRFGSEIQRLGAKLIPRTNDAGGALPLKEGSVGVDDRLSTYWESFESCKQM